jgi:Protein of unknown function (DUF3828)
VPSRRLLVLTALCVLPGVALAQGQSQSQGQVPRDTLTPEAFLRGIYTPYPNHDFKGQPFWQVNRFFAPDLARAIEADMREAKRRGEAPKLDGDPFVDAQDWDIAKLSISVKADGPRAVGFVSFENLGKPTQIQLDLVRTSAGWRIADIEAPSGKLSDLYK